jgi:uncharacterized protein
MITASRLKSFAFRLRWASTGFRVSILLKKCVTCKVSRVFSHAVKLEEGAAIRFGELADGGFGGGGFSGGGGWSGGGGASGSW